MKKDEEDGLSSAAVGYGWAIRISTFSLEFAALAGLGVFVDRRFNVAPWGALIGAGLGVFVFGSGLWSVVKRFEEIENEKSAAKSEDRAK